MDKHIGKYDGEGGIKPYKVEVRNSDILEIPPILFIAYNMKHPVKIEIKGNR